MGDEMTDKCMSVGLLCSVIGHTVDFWQTKWPGNVWEETKEGKEWHWDEIKGTKIDKAFAENRQISDCFVETSLQALISQLGSIHWTLNDQVTHLWKKCEWERNKWMTSVIGVIHKWLRSVPDEMQVLAECLASAHRGRAADLRVIFTRKCSWKQYYTYKVVVSQSNWSCLANTRASDL